MEDRRSFSRSSSGREHIVDEKDMRIGDRRRGYAEYATHVLPASLGPKSGL